MTATSVTPACAATRPALHPNSVSQTVEDSMNTRTRPSGAPAYYLGRPAAFWLAASARRPTAHRSHRAPCTSSIDGHGVAATGRRRGGLTGARRKGTGSQHRWLSARPG